MILRSPGLDHRAGRTNRTDGEASEAVLFETS
jgi:hypothetical protein